MAFNVEQHANLGFIDRPYKEALETIRTLPHHKRSLKDELEWMIAELAKKEKVNINK